MTPPPSRKSVLLLIVVDTLILLAITLYGFIQHESSMGGGRWLTTFLPMGAAWAAAAIPIGLYQADIARLPSQIWRVLLAAILAGPLAALLRGLWLGGVVIPIFALILIGFSAGGVGLWRLIWALSLARKF